MPKIALISYHFYHNYGTCLQAYALWHRLNSWGVNCEFLNFGQCRCNENFAQKIKNVLRRVKYLKYGMSAKSNGKCFESFRKKYVHETKEFRLDELNCVESQYDKFILGSDQTLNPDCVNENVYECMLLCFVKDEKKKFSFASSLGKYKLTNNQEEKLKRLQNFQEISVREKNTQKKLAMLLNRNVEFVLDPTFLLSKEEWLQLANPDFSAKASDYVFCYLLGANEDVVLFAKRLAQEMKLKLVLFTIYPKLSHSADLLLKKCGPFEFVKTIAEARYVVTDSFHGSILSINCHVNFYSFFKRPGGLYQGDNGRLYDFLCILDLQNRLLSDSSLDLLQDIDFEKVERKLDSIRSLSIDFLKKIVDFKEKERD